MSRATGMAPRTLQRWFARHVGLPPRRYLRLLRFQKAFEKLSGEAVAGRPRRRARLRRPGAYGPRIPRLAGAPREPRARRDGARLRSFPKLLARPPEAVDEAVGAAADDRVEDVAE